MPTIITHAIVPLLPGAASGSRAIPKRLLGLCAVAAMLPDLDVLTFHFGIPYASQFGHRGASHSLMAALAVGLLATLLARWLGTSRLRVFAAVTLSVASHPLLDACTDGGHGVALLWPFSTRRFFAAFAPVEVSPLGMRFFSHRGLEVMVSEMLWIWLPLLVIALVILWIRRQSQTVNANPGAGLRRSPGSP